MNRFLCTAVAAALSTMAPMASAQGTSPYAGTNDWVYELKLYLWGTEIKETAGGKELAIGFDKIVENLNFALMGALVAFRDPWLVFGEFSYAHLTKDGDRSFALAPGEPAGGIDAFGDVDIKERIFSFGGGYKLAQTDSYQLYGTFGARYLNLDTDFQVDANAQSFKFSDSASYWDAVVGLNGRAMINENWFVPFNFDIGTGQSDMTWQALVGIGYEYGRGDVVFGYREMDWDLPEDEFVTSYNKAGPFLLWNIRF
ncbi:hypothetical protein CLV78_101170 [Aliiruegeria haliotis]|uniref:Nucleoside-specific outer membrane channel protein Tsx n=1 Tax=Aliiruegeria haliotis TaxID=1280846 RepID=A0A2T0RY40_9RHOB|nr:hypothetical protein [Aliiruegeria haliotis]PRY26077.1 hypothetical protein CLV78_101170 [Aliiruegeria haliotis]